MKTTIDLEKQLVKRKRATLSTEDQLLLDRIEHNEDMQKKYSTLSNILGIDSQMSLTSQALEKKNRADKFPKDRVFTMNDIKDLCCRYGLRFLEIHKYKNFIPEELADKLLKLKADKWTLDRKVMIVAPKSSFHLQERPKDPLCFLEIYGGTEANDFTDKLFYLVHKWGDDISWTRWLKFLFTRNKLTINLTVFSGGLFIANLIGILVLLCDSNSETYTSDVILAFVLGNILALVIGLAFFGITFDDDNIGQAGRWNSSYKN